MINIVLFGKPGAGKGTQAEFLKEKYKLTHLSTGDIFRFNLKNDTDLGKKARVFMDNGELVPCEVTTAMLIDEVNKNPDAVGFLFDGYPRTLDQAQALDKFLPTIGSSVTATIALEICISVAPSSTRPIKYPLWSKTASKLMPELPIKIKQQSMLLSLSSFAIATDA